MMEMVDAGWVLLLLLLLLLFMPHARKVFTGLGSNQVWDKKHVCANGTFLTCLAICGWVDFPCKTTILGWHGPDITQEFTQIYAWYLHLDSSWWQNMAHVAKHNIQGLNRLEIWNQNLRCTFFKMAKMCYKYMFSNKSGKPVHWLLCFSMYLSLLGGTQR